MGNLKWKFYSNRKLNKEELEYFINSLKNGYYNWIKPNMNIYCIIQIFENETEITNDYYIDGAKLEEIAEQMENGIFENVLTETDLIKN